MKKILNEISCIKDVIKETYLNDKRPFVVGYSGGKDSSLLLQLVLEVLDELNNCDLLYKTSYIISSDTLIENPIVSNLITNTFEGLSMYKDKLKISLVHVKPKITETFWFSLLGKGYPLPLNRFRWCTRQLKISPMQEIEKNLIKKHLGIISVVGLRKKESESRKNKMQETHINGNYYKNSENENSVLFAPLSNLDIETLWKYLLYIRESFWGSDFGVLYESYFDSKSECPMALELSEKEELIEKCGNSRWGCWMCPLSNHIWIDGMVNNGYTEFKPLADFRERLLLERDLNENRYNGKHIIWSTGKITLGNRGLNKIKPISQNTYIQIKKLGRKERIFKRNRTTFTVDKADKYKIISNDEFANLYKSNRKLFYHESKRIKRIIEKDDGYYIPGLGPYTISYRIDKLEELLQLQETINNIDYSLWAINKIELITKEEINDILKLNLRLSKLLNKKELIKRIIILQDKIQLQEEIQRNIEKSKNILLDMFYLANRNMLVNNIRNLRSNVSESNTCANLMYELRILLPKTQFKEYYVDVEYNRNYDEVKTIINREEKKIKIIPDLIIHSRGENVIQDNLLVLEMEKSYRKGKEKQDDKIRLKAMTKKCKDMDSLKDRKLPDYVCGYLIGIYYEIDIQNNMVVLEIYSEGKKTTKFTKTFDECIDYRSMHL